MNESETRGERKPGRLRRTAISVLRIVVVAYVGLALLLFLFQSHFIYRPSDEMEGTPKSFGMEYEEVSLKTEDGLKLNAWYVPAEGATHTLLFFHGNAGNISGRLASIDIFHRLGLSVLIVDYRGYGRSEGDPSEEGTRLDALAAWDHLVTERKFAPDRIVIFGRSLGGGVAAQLARENRPAALILESTFTSVPDMAADKYFFLPLRWLCRFSYDTQASLADTKCPVLVVHSADDDMIPFSHGKALFEAASEPKEMLTISGPHNGGMFESIDIYVPGLTDFLARHVKTPVVP